MRTQRSHTPRSRQQRGFLRKIREEVLPAHDLLRQSGVNGETLASWMRGKRFKRAVNKELRNVRWRLMLELELGRLAGARKLTTLSQSARDQNVARLASLNLVTMGQICREVMRKNPRPNEKASTESGTSHDQPYPVHPDVPPDEARRLIEEMEKEAREGQR